MCGFIAQLVEHRTGIAEVTGSNPVEALIFFQASSFQLLKLENLLRRSFFTLIYHRSSHMNYFIYASRQDPMILEVQASFVTTGDNSILAIALTSRWTNILYRDRVKIFQAATWRTCYRTKAMVKGFNSNP